MNAQYSPLPVRCRSVSVVPLRQIQAGAEMLLVRRAETLVGTWSQISGGIELGEAAWQAALRELQEEAGLTADRLYAADHCEQFYDPGLEEITLVPVFVAMVSADAPVVLNAENTAHRWCLPEVAEDLVPFSGQRAMLRHVAAEFIARAPSPWQIVHPVAERPA
ncbi:MAG: NUDIX domain-containing protein [Pseudomonadota bacterium]